MIIWVLIGSLLLLIGWLLFTPMVIHLDTEQALYEVRWAGVRVQPILDEEGPGLRLIAPFIRKEIHFGASSAGKVTGPNADREQRKQHPSHSASSGSWRIVPRIIRSFRVRHFRLTWDTDDVLWNAWLFPIFHLLRLRGHDVRISFTGHSALQLTLENNIYRLLMAVLFNQPKHQSHEQGHE